MSRPTRTIWEADQGDTLLMLSTMATAAATAVSVLRGLGEGEPLLCLAEGPDGSIGTRLDWLEEVEEELAVTGRALLEAADAATVDDEDTMSEEEPL